MRRLLFVIALAPLLALLTGTAFMQPLPVPSVPLFSDADPAALRAVVMLPEQAGTLRTRTAQLDPAALSQLRGGALTLNLFGDAAFTAVGGLRSQSVTRTSSSSTLWLGSLAGVPYSNVIMMTDAAGNIDLRVLMRSRSYFVQSLGGGIVRISELEPGAGRYDASRQPIEDAIIVQPTGAEQRETVLNSQSPRADDGTVIDVLVVYTPAAVALLGSEAAARLAIESAVALANVTYENSGVDFRLRLVHLARIDYAELGSANDLNRLRGTSDGYMDIVHQWRDQYAADLVALIPGTSAANRSYCGIANLPAALPSSASAFSITEALCINDITFAHELGHNMGKAHDRANAAFAVHPYAFGYQDQSEGPGDYGDWVTVMAYSNGGECPASYTPGECPAIAYWSDSGATYNGKILGRPGSNGEDNQRSLNETASTIANYRISADGGAAVPSPQPTLTPIPTPGPSVVSLPLNGGFEQDNDDNGTPDGWWWAVAAGKRVCGSQRWGGDCALVLKPGGKLAQIVPLDLAALGQGDMLTLSAYIFPKSNPAGCASARLIITYVDGTAGLNGDGRDSLVLPFANTPVKQWQPANALITLDGQPSRVKLELETKGCTGALRLDDLLITAGAP